MFANECWEDGDYYCNASFVIGLGGYGPGLFFD